MKIGMLLFNDFVQDLRVHKEARDLAAAGHEVLVVATRTRFDLAETESRSGYHIRRFPISSAWRTEIRPGLQRVTTERPHSVAGRVVDAIRRHPRRREWASERARSRFGEKAAEFLTGWRPDAVHAHDLDTLDFGARVAARTQVPLVYDSHELWRESNFLRKKSAGTQARWRSREATYAPEAHTVILTEVSRAEAFKDWYPGTEPVVVMNCQDGTPIERTNLLRERLGFTSEIRILLYQGLIHADRGLCVALSALPHLPETFVFVAIGPGQDVSEFRREIRDRALEHRAFVLPPVHHESLAELTAGADYGLSLVQNTCLSYYLAAPNKLFEFMRAGLPIVASDFPEVRRIFEEGDLGERIDPADPGALARAILRLEGDPDRRARIANDARRLVRDRYNWQHESAKLLKIYETLATRP
jgi:glycosyltransferase involved in cell wall biosynthesis